MTLTGENFFDSSDTGLLLVRLTRELSNDLDEKLVHVVRECIYDEDNSQVQFTFPSGIFTDHDWVILELSFDEISWTLA